jgi:hypothetical protein
MRQAGQQAGGQQRTSVLQVGIEAAQAGELREGGQVGAGDLAFILPQGVHMQSQAS